MTCSSPELSQMSGSVFRFPNSLLHQHSWAVLLGQIQVNYISPSSSEDRTSICLSATENVKPRGAARCRAIHHQQDVSVSLSCCLSLSQRDTSWHIVRCIEMLILHTGTFKKDGGGTGNIWHSPATRSTLWEHWKSMNAASCARTIL